jgi:hypothetical protein
MAYIHSAPAASGVKNGFITDQAQTIAGAKTFSSTPSAGSYTSTVATGTAPLTVASATVVSNLNADLLDGQQGSWYQSASNINAGTLGTDYFSAYADLTAESKIGAGSTQVAAGDHTHSGSFILNQTASAQTGGFWINGSGKSLGGHVWGTGYASALINDQGGAIGIGDSTSSGLTPYLDFRFGHGSTQNYNVRIQNTAENTLTMYYNNNGSIGTRFIAANTTFGGASTIISNARMETWTNATYQRILFTNNLDNDVSSYLYIQLASGDHGTAYANLGSRGSLIMGLSANTDNFITGSADGDACIYAKASKKLFLGHQSSTDAVGVGSITIQSAVTAAGGATGTSLIGIDNTAPDQKLCIKGGDQSLRAGPHIKITGSGDAYTMYHFLNWSHDSIHQGYDAYYDGTNWKSASASTNLKLAKASGQFIIGVASGVAAGATISAWSNAFAIDINDSDIYHSSNSMFGTTSTSPTDKVHILDQNNAGFRFDEYSSTSGAVMRLRSAQGTLASPTQVVANWIIGSVRGFGWQSGGAFSTAARATMDMFAAESWTASAQGSYIAFNTTASGSTTTSEKVRITGAGDMSVTGDIYTTALTDWSASSNPQGFTGSLTANQVTYKKIGKFIYLWFYIQGTSGGSVATTFSFTLPEAAATPISGFLYMGSLGQTTNGSTGEAVGTWQIAAGATVCTLARSPHQAWTGSGTKLAYGSVCYPTA